ncbi:MULTISPECIES: hypothetical protein [Rhizobiaceae]|jgi:hypothetical protein|uniref:Uncharacterized protein n=1 Tax=Aliirhizobium cellulosilyticum TaxID=393664 RepID=A0A7W6WP55_9HYPH|nr:hypothetical protein [Rhizobium cellulosilyticum]MBB4348604.1 hypothetical protein [Rhizobium cellulosilyticum]MBB4411840.1 hypothetical protein [Rhizobium cellulosilyticum]MBB4446531.1 hypothetical protein [Rhizobium cellulosilyticum]
MVYEWDEKRARRAYLARVGLSILAITITLGVSAAIAIAMSIG